MFKYPKIITPQSHHELTCQEFSFRVLDHIICKDGFDLSCQGSSTHYCEPQKVLDLNDYEAVELLCEDDKMLKSYSTGSSVYGYVPIEVVKKLIAKHGGQVIPDFSCNYTQEHHKIIQDYAIALYMAETDPNYPEHNQIKIDRINAVPVDFDNIFDFGLDAGKQKQLAHFAVQAGIDNPVFSNLLKSYDNLWEELQVQLQSQT